LQHFFPCFQAHLLLFPQEVALPILESGQMIASPSEGRGGYKPAEVETARPGYAHSFSECTF